MAFHMRVWQRVVLVILAVIVLGPILLIKGCDLYYESRSAVINYRITVTLDDNGIERSGYSVVSVSYKAQYPLLPGMGPYSVLARQEAVMIELPGRGRLFALLGGGKVSGDSFDPRWPMNDYIALYKVIPEADLLTRINALKRLGEKSRVTLRRGCPDGSQKPDCYRNNYPGFVCFGTPMDFSSIRLLSPDDFYPCFGPGVRLKSVTMEVTDEPLTNNHIEQFVDMSFPYNGFSNLEKDDPRGAISPSNFRSVM